MPQLRSNFRDSWSWSKRRANAWFEPGATNTPNMRRSTLTHAASHKVKESSLWRHTGVYHEWNTRNEIGAQFEHINWRGRAQPSESLEVFKIQNETNEGANAWFELGTVKCLQKSSVYPGCRLDFACWINFENSKHHIYQVCCNLSLSKCSLRWLAVIQRPNTMSFFCYSNFENGCVCSCLVRFCFRNWSIEYTLTHWKFCRYVKSSRSTVRQNFILRDTILYVDSSFVSCRSRSSVVVPDS